MMRCFKLGKKESDIMTKSNTSNIGMRMDSNLKTAADKLHEELDMDEVAENMESLGFSI